ncbi:hypothetical protein [Bacillus marasmi]|uniref:hypothetical protein n=1 Tax=Bacillus marasmi TaxID=1926279 RepID=UPI0011C881E9|nr:hypothetical protein [Bacillus marasmi]
MKKRKDTVSTGTITVCAFVFPGAETGTFSASKHSAPVRIKREIACANSIWKRVSGNVTKNAIRFKLIKTIIFPQTLKGLEVNAENISMNAKKLMKNAKLLLGLAEKYGPEADLYVYYMDGEQIGATQEDGARVLAITYIDYPIIIMSNGAQKSDFILAHEIGHFLFNTNRFGDTNDPQPIRGDPAHNVEPTNLMYPTGMYWPKPPNMPFITSEQLYKALNSKLFY